MDFAITALDYKNQLEKRIANRDAHVKGLTQAAKNGTLISAGAITNDKGEMIGSSVHVRFESRAALDEWLANEPYVTGNVWESIDIKTVNLIDVAALKAQ
ncbi:MAG: YciI family protein [Arenicella sp.]